MPPLAPEIAALLPPGAYVALAEALSRPLSYSARCVLTPLPERRVVVILGEAHVKLGLASALGKALVSCFELRGVETFQRRQITAGRWLGFLIHAPRALLRALSFGLVKDSTIVDAKAITSGATVELERASSVPLSLHVASVYLAAMFSVLYPLLLLRLAGLGVPHWLSMLGVAFEFHTYLLLPAYVFRREPWAWLIHPGIALVTVRDSLMAAGTVRMLRQHPHASAVVVMGRAHVAGYERELIERHGFVRC